MEQFERWPILGTLHTHADFKALPEAQLPSLAEEIRHYLSFRVRENGGHLASNLGVVELTMAIHRVFSLPHDHLIFDVGHQSYVHKLLTGRGDRFDTLRRPGGISGFTKRAESEYDAFGAGHSSTAISAAIGMAEADAMAGRDAYTVAVVGDGALTGGLSYEGLNNCRRNLKLIIILNENEMSISPNTGRLATHLAKIRGSHNYLKTKELTSHTIRHIPLVGKGLYRVIRWLKRRVKHLFYKENMFEHMGIRYLGPVDGNDLGNMIASLNHAKSIGTSVILHVKTTKGKGDKEAEATPDVYHGIAPHCAAGTAVSFSQHCGETLCRMAKDDQTLVAITAAMSHGTGLEPFRLQYPKRFFDVGIAEGHAVTFAGGLAAGGVTPVVAVYSTFLQRAVDNVLHDVALQGLPLILCVDRAGFNAADGATHHGVFDVSFLSAIDGVRIFAPVTLSGLAASLTAAKKTGGVAAIRYPSGCENRALLDAFYGGQREESDPPTVRVFDSGENPTVTVLTHGRIAAEALKAASTLLENGVAVRILLCEYLAPYGELAAEVAPLLSGNSVVFYEEEIRHGGFGICLSDALTTHGALKGKKTAIVAAERAFVTPASGETMWQAAGVDATALLRAVQKLQEQGE